MAEPVHSTGYLPMYIAMAKGYFAEADIEVKIVTIETGGGHTNAVLSGQAFAFIGGPEHNAFAKAKGAELRAVVHCVDRGNVYFCAAKGNEPKDTRLGLPTSRARRSRSAPYGGTPNSITRYLLKKWKLDAKKDVTLHEMPNSAVLAAVKGGQAADRRHDRADDHAGHQAGPLERAVLQRAEGARPLRLLDHQHPAGLRSRRSPRWCAASCAA